MTEKFRADHSGSLLRPESLLAARRAHDAGEVTDPALREIEDAAIEAAVGAQEAAGIGVVTDGEFRRRDFRSGFAQAVDGIVCRGNQSSQWMGEGDYEPIAEELFGRLAVDRLRIDEAAKYADYDDLALSPQCGFASIAEGGNLLTEAEQYAKLKLVADVARATWN